MFQQRFPIPRNFGLGGLRPCNHCKLIDSGDVAMYGVTCPECGEVPPSKKHMYPNFNANVKCYFHKCNNKLRNLITDWLNITKNDNTIFEYQKFRQSVICSTEIFDQLNL